MCYFLFISIKCCITTLLVSCVIQLYNVIQRYICNILYFCKQVLYLREISRFLTASLNDMSFLNYMTMFQNIHKTLHLYFYQCRNNIVFWFASSYFHFKNLKRYCQSFLIGYCYKNLIYYFYFIFYAKLDERRTQKVLKVTYRLIEQGTYVKRILLILKATWNERVQLEVRKLLGVHTPSV